MSIEYWSFIFSAKLGRFGEEIKFVVVESSNMSWTKFSMKLEHKIFVLYLYKGCAFGLNSTTIGVILGMRVQRS